MMTMKRSTEVIVLLLAVAFVSGGCSDSNVNAVDEVLPGDTLMPYAVTETALLPWSTARDICIDKYDRIWVSGNFGPDTGRRDTRSYAVRDHGVWEYHAIQQFTNNGIPVWWEGKSIDCLAEDTTAWLMLEDTHVFMLPDNRIEALSGGTILSWRSTLCRMGNGNLVFVGKNNGIIWYTDKLRTVPLQSGEDWYVEAVQKSLDARFITFVLKEPEKASHLMLYDSETGDVEEVFNTDEAISAGLLSGRPVVTATCLDGDDCVFGISKSYADHRVYRLSGFREGGGRLVELFRAPHYVRCVQMDERGQVVFAGDRGMIGTYYKGEVHICENTLEQKYKAVYRIICRGNRIWAVGTSDCGFIFEGVRSLQ
jgi:hypothetical protein